MKSHIFRFVCDNLFIFNHSITLQISALIKLSALALLFMSLKESIVLDNVVSSSSDTRALLRLERTMNSLSLEGGRGGGGGGEGRGGRGGEGSPPSHFGNILF